MVAILAAGLERALKRGRKFGERLEPPLDFPAELPVTTDYNQRKRVQDAGSYHLVNAVWPGIVDAEKFERVQRLMAANCRSGHNESRL